MTTTGVHRQALSRERVLDGAVELTDEIGIEAFTIRRLAAALDVKPMTIYHHVPSKEQIIDGMVDIVFDQIGLPATDVDWRTGIRARCVSARSVLRRHPWAPPLMESRRTPGPATLRHHDAVLACLRAGRPVTRADRARVRGHRQLRLRLRAPGSQSARRRRRRDRGAGRVDGHGGTRRLSRPSPSSRPSGSCGPATGSATPSSSGWTSSSMGSTAPPSVRTEPNDEVWIQFGIRPDLARRGR